jgi:hypothetical protein
VYSRRSCDELDQLIDFKICERSFLREVVNVRRGCPEDLGECETLLETMED